jgi:hypothetical protein
MVSLALGSSLDQSGLEFGVRFRCRIGLGPDIHGGFGFRLKFGFVFVWSWGGLGWVGLGWVGLGWVGLGWVGGNIPLHSLKWQADKLAHFKNKKQKTAVNTKEGPVKVGLCLCLRVCVCVFVRAM